MNSSFIEVTPYYRDGQYTILVNMDDVFEVTPHDGCTVLTFKTTKKTFVVEDSFEDIKRKLGLMPQEKMEVN